MKTPDKVTAYLAESRDRTLRDLAHKRRQERITRWLVAALVAASLVALGVWQRDHIACPTEDSAACVWWGPMQGNGRGAIVINGTD